MRPLIDIRAELRTLDDRRLKDDATYRRLMLELLLNNAISMHQINASNGGDPDWRYEQTLVTTESTRVLEVKKGDIMMVRLHNWDDDELRVVYYGLDGPVSADQGTPIQPGEEKIFSANADVWVISPYRGDLIYAPTGLDSNDTIPISEDGGTTWLLAKVVPGEYETGQAYAIAVQNGMNAVGASVYTVTYNPTTRTLTYTSDGSGGLGTFDVGYLTGDGNTISNRENAGFNRVDKTGALSYISDNPLPDNPVPLRVGQALPFKKHDRDFF